MPKNKEWTKTMRGAQLLAPGDVIRLMDEGAPVRCRVLSCIALDDGGCVASVEIVEGVRTGEKIRARLRTDGDKHGP